MPLIKGMPFRYKGSINVEDCKTSEEVIRKAHLDWEVAKCAMVARMPLPVEESDITDAGFVHNGEYYRTCDNAFATYRTDKNIPLGVVKERYTEVQNLEAFKFFDEAIGKDKAIWQTAGFFGNGERIFVSAKLPHDIIVNGNDKVENYLVFTNSHDGSSGVKILFTPIRVVCENTLNAAIKSTKNFVSFRHTQSVHSNIDSARELLGITKNIAEDLNDYYIQMANSKITDDQAMNYFADIILSNEEKVALKTTGFKVSDIILKVWSAIEASNISMKKVNALANINDYYHVGPGQKETLGTTWGAYNAITGYYSNMDNAEGLKRMDSLLYGSRAVKIQTAGNLALEYDYR